MSTIPRLEVDADLIPRLPPPVVEPLRPTPVVPPLQLELAPPVLDIRAPTLRLPAMPVVPANPASTLTPVIRDAKKNKTVTAPQDSVTPTPPVPYTSWGPSFPTRTSEEAPRPKPPKLKVVKGEEGEPKSGSHEVDSYRMEVGGLQVSVPTARKVVELSLTTVIITLATLLTLNVVKRTQRVLGLQIALVLRRKKEKKKKDKLKAKMVKPLLHFVRNGNDLAIVISYEPEKTEVVIENVRPEEYLRERVDEDFLYESVNQIVIDESLKEFFTKEGKERFKYFVPPAKFVKKLSARVSL